MCSVGQPSPTYWTTPWQGSCSAYTPVENYATSKEHRRVASPWTSLGKRIRTKRACIIHPCGTSIDSCGDGSTSCPSGKWHKSRKIVSPNRGRKLSGWPLLGTLDARIHSFNTRTNSCSTRTVGRWTKVFFGRFCFSFRIVRIALSVFRVSHP